MRNQISTELACVEEVPWTAPSPPFLFLSSFRAHTKCLNSVLLLYRQTKKLLISFLSSRIYKTWKVLLLKATIQTFFPIEFTAADNVKLRMRLLASVIVLMT